MKAILDPDICFGCELCVQSCPEVFAMNGDKAKVIVIYVPNDYESSCRDAADQCPVDAITLEE